MQFLDLTLPSPEENVALDEALLDAAEAGELSDEEVLRLWEPRQPAVIIGRSSHVEQEVCLSEATRRQVPVVRRATGGAAIVTAPGCLMYAVVLSYERRPHLRPLDAAHRFVLNRIADAINRQAGPVQLAGTSDLTYGDRKISGNSMRAKRTHFLYHGTILYAMNLTWISDLLLPPPRQPDYRRNRQHQEFVGNLALNVPQLKRDLCDVWEVDGVCPIWPAGRTRQLVESCYGKQEWTYRF